MDGRQVIAFEIVLDRQLPVGRQVETEAEAVLGEKRSILERGPALLQRRQRLVQRGPSAVGIDEDGIVPDAAAHRHEAEIAGIETGALVDARAADMGRGAERAVEPIAPGVIRGI